MNIIVSAYKTDCCECSCSTMCFTYPFVWNFIVICDNIAEKVVIYGFIMKKKNKYFDENVKIAFG